MKAVSRIAARRGLTARSASAAGTAIQTARRVAVAATVRLFSAAWWMCAERVRSNSAAYQRSENEGGGNFSPADDVNDVISATSTGPTRMISAQAASRPTTA